jgi:tripartite-type tricarboxylate transporter receptor subunit TctC
MDAPRGDSMFDRSVPTWLAAFACAAVVGASSAAFAQSSLTIVVPFAAGGTSDISMRAIAGTVEEAGGPRITIENRPGGGGVPAAVAVKDAAPNGQTLFLANYATFVVNAAMTKNFPFDPTVDFRPITTLFSFPLMLAVPSSIEAKTVPELVALAKKKSGGLSYGSQGVGTAGHLLGELFAKASGAPLVHVPYKGAAQGVVDLVAGRLDMMFIGVLPTKPHLESGKLRALAVTSKTRLPEVPAAPTTAESGYPDVNTDFVWFGLAAPARTPEAVVASLHDRFTKALRSKALQQKLAEQGVDLGASTPDGFVARIKADTARFGPLIRESGATR